MKSIFKIWRMSYICCMAVCLLSIGQVSMAKSTHSVLQEAVERGSLRVGISSFIPWAMQNKKGEYIGFEVDIARRLAEDFDIELELFPTRWSGIVPALLTGKFDMIISGLSVTAERSLRVNFTRPYDYVYIEAVGRHDMLGDATDFETLNTPETIVAVRTGTTAAIAARKKLPKATIRSFDDEAPALQEMATGRAHILFASTPLGSFEVVRDSAHIRHLSKEQIFPQPIAIALRKGDIDSLNALDAWIRVIEGEGWLKERKAYWFQSKEWESLLQ